MAAFSRVYEDGPGRALAQAVQYGGRRQVKAGRKSTEETHDFTVVGDVEGWGGHCCRWERGRMTGALLRKGKRSNFQHLRAENHFIDIFYTKPYPGGTSTAPIGHLRNSPR